MKHLWSTAMVLLCACAPALQVPQELVINCLDDDQCPDAMSCRGTVCVRDVEIDRSPPTLVSVQPAGPQAIVLTFSERIARDEAQSLASYVSVPPLAFVSATLGVEAQTVVLAVQRQQAVPYEITVANVRDESGNVIVAPNDRGTFTGVPPPNDTTPPEPLVPALHERLLGATMAELRWSERSGAASYHVDVAYDALFQNPIVGSPFTIVSAAAGGNPESTLRIATSAAVTYFWRVRADVTAGATLASDFDVVGDVLHVYCESYPGCTDTGSAGNVTRPYRTITSALANAKLDGIARVKVAGRGVGQPYEELVTLVNGVSLYGGFDPTFDDSIRDVDTVISNSSVITVYAEKLDQKTVVDGFTIKGGVGRKVHTIEATKADGLVLINDVIDGGHAVEESVAVHIADSGRVGGLRPTLVGCTLLPAEDEPRIVIGVDAATSHIRIEGSTVEAGDASELSIGARLDGSVTMTGSTMKGGVTLLDVAAQSCGVQLSTNTGDPPSRMERNVLESASSNETFGLLTRGSATEPMVVANNIVRSGSGAKAAFGAYIGRSIFVGNTVTVSACATMQNCRRVALSALTSEVNDTVVANNILRGQADSGGSGACFGMRTGGAGDAQSVSRIENNLMFDCPTAFVQYDYGVALGPQLTSMVDVNDPAKYAGTVKPAAAGNLTDPNGATYFTSPSTGDWSLDDSTPATITGGGLDASSSTYGGVTDDFSGSPRTCDGPGVCYSIGAHERD